MINKREELKGWGVDRTGRDACSILIRSSLFHYCSHSPNSSRSPFLSQIFILQLPTLNVTTSLLKFLFFLTETPVIPLIYDRTGKRTEVMENIFPTEKYHFFFVYKTMTWVNFFFFLNKHCCCNITSPQLKYLKQKEFRNLVELWTEFVLYIRDFQRHLKCFFLDDFQCCLL